MNLCMKLSTPASCAPPTPMPTSTDPWSGISGCLWPIERKLKQNLIANRHTHTHTLPIGELGGMEWLLLQSDIAKFQLPDAIVTVIVCVCVCVRECSSVSVSHSQDTFCQADNSPSATPTPATSANVSHVECGCQDSFL